METQVPALSRNVPSMGRGEQGCSLCTFKFPWGGGGGANI